LVPRPYVLSVDLESSLAGVRRRSLARHGPGFSRVLPVHDQALAGAEPLPSGAVLIRRFLEYLRDLDPDVITGWNVVDFDLTVLARAARRCGLRLAVGRTDDEFAARRETSYGAESRAIVYGRLVLDALSLMRGAFIRLQDYRLETAAQAFLGRGKLLAGDHRAEEIERLYRSDPRRLVEY